MPGKHSPTLHLLCWFNFFETWSHNVALGDFKLKSSHWSVLALRLALQACTRMLSSRNAAVLEIKPQATCKLSNSTTLRPKTVFFASH